MREIFPQRNLIILECVVCNFRTQVDFYNTANPKSKQHGLETLRHLAPIVWNAVRKAIRDSLSLGTFKARIKLWDSSYCPCRLYKTYVQELGFVNM